MKLGTSTAFLALAAAACALPAHAGVAGPAQVTCDGSFTVFNAGYIACSGPLADALAPTVSFAGHGTFTRVGLTGDLSGAFVADPGAVSFGNLAFGSARSGAFVVGLDGGASRSWYLFDAGSSGSIAAIDFDTYGLADAAGGAGPNLVRAALYRVSAVPEPATAALWLAGLGVAGGAGRLARRRALQPNG